MKTCISRLVTFINHLWRTWVSTLVERWLQKHTTDINCSLEPGWNWVSMTFDDGNTLIMECDRLTEDSTIINIHLSRSKEDGHDSKSN